MKEPVTFDVDHVPFTVEYDRVLLRLGALVHVSRHSGGSYTFEATPTSSSIPHAVLSISKRSWFVSLTTGYRVDVNLVARVASVLQVEGDVEWISKAVAVAASDIRLTHQYKTKEVERSRLNLITTVTERLELARVLESDEVALPLGQQWEPLTTYLMLTCFDRLGQPAMWRDFSSWLSSKSCQIERQCPAAIQSGDDATSAALNLHRLYCDLYGTRSAFFRFLREILPEAARGRLYQSVDVFRFDLASDSAATGDDIEDKERWLYRLRNDYTHNARFIRGIPKDLFQRLGTPPDMWLVGRDPRVDGSRRTDIALRSWPYALVEAVRDGFRQYLRVLSSPQSI